MSFCSAWPPPWETANILLSHGHRKPSSWSGKERATTRANTGQGAGVWAQILKREVISDREPSLEMKPGDFIADWAWARKLYLCCMDVKIIWLSMCALMETKQTRTAAIIRVQHYAFVIGQINVGTQTINTNLLRQLSSFLKTQAILGPCTYVNYISRPKSGWSSLGQTQGQTVSTCAATPVETRACPLECDTKKPATSSHTARHREEAGKPEGKEQGTEERWLIW